jgi:Ca-activated chloride channel homolog
MPKESISTIGLNNDADRSGNQPRPADLWAAAAPFVVLFSLFPLALAQAQQPPAAPPAEAIRVSVDRVNVGVIVTDARGNFIGGLRRDDFHILDDGVEQPITDFAPIDEPAQVLMLIEAGPAVYFLEAGHVRATHAFLDGLSTGDQVSVVKYDAAPQLLLNFTPNKQAAEGALVNVRYYLGFGALNLSQSLSTVLDWLAKVQGKKTIVLLSTGFDTSSPEQSAALLSRLKTTDVRILAISLGAEIRNPPPHPKSKNKPAAKAASTQQGFADADRLLTVLTQTTGGRVFFPNSAKDFADVYAEIAQLVRHEYSLAFAPPAHDGKIHAIEVRVSPASTPAPDTPPPAYRIDHRTAYLAPGL